MSTTVGIYGASGNNYVLQQSISTLTQEQQDLSAQASSGKKASTYVGLGSDRAQALSLNPQITQVAAWQTSISSAQTSLSLTSTALTEISSIATDLQTDLTSMNGTLGKTSLATIVSSASDALSKLGTLLNTTGNNGYIFAGRASDVAPVTDASGLGTSELATVTSDAVSQLDTLGASAVFAQATQYASSGATYTDSTTGTTYDLSVFSSNLSTDPVSAASLENKAVVGTSDTVNVGMVATEGTSSGDNSTTTGSVIRDLMRNLMVVASMGNVDTSSTNYTDLVSTLLSSTTSIADTLTTEESSIGLTQNTLTNQASTLTTTNTMLSSQLSDIVDLDSTQLAAVSVQVSTVKDQLETSYALIADMKGMTLADYL